METKKIDMDNLGPLDGIPAPAREKDVWRKTFQDEEAAKAELEAIRATHLPRISSELRDSYDSLKSIKRERPAKLLIFSMGGDHAPLAEDRAQAENLQAKIDDHKDSLELLNKRVTELERILREADKLRGSLALRMEKIREMRALGHTISPDGRVQLR
jgi:DNA repair exonuclease SbcCD ATPase subunit